MRDFGNGPLGLGAAWARRSARMRAHVAQHGDDACGRVRARDRSPRQSWVSRIGEGVCDAWYLCGWAQGQHTENAHRRRGYNRGRETEPPDRRLEQWGNGPASLWTLSMNIFRDPTAVRSPEASVLNSALTPVPGWAFGF